MYPSNSEPTVEELLADPVASLLMARDGLHPEDVRSYVGAVRRQLEAAKIQERAASGMRERTDKRGVA